MTMKILPSYIKVITAISVATFLFLSGSCVALKSNPTYITQSDKYHVVEKGDTLYKISQKYSITVEQLKLFNNLTDEKVIIGQKIFLTPSDAPKNEYVTQKPIPKNGYHTVKKGETIYRISKIYNLEIMDIMQFNNLETFDIKEGQKVWLTPNNIATSTAQIKNEQNNIDANHDQKDINDIHIVTKGENLYRISLKYGMTVNQIKELNNLQSDDIEVGQKLTVKQTKENTKKTAKSTPKKTTPAASVKRKDLHIPLKGKVVSEFGIRNNLNHNGIDIAAPTGEPIYAALAGKAVFVGTQRGYGNVVILEHPDYVMTVYAHNERNLVRLGESVKKGQPIATVGQTGNASGPHLHFEYRIKGKAINPRNVLYGI